MHLARIEEAERRNVVEVLHYPYIRGRESPSGR